MPALDPNSIIYAGNGAYLDQSTGYYYTGTWDNPVQWGTTPESVGQGSGTSMPGVAPPEQYAPAAPPAPAPGNLGNDNYMIPVDSGYVPPPAGGAPGIPPTPFPTSPQGLVPPPPPPMAPPAPPPGPGMQSSSQPLTHTEVTPPPSNDDASILAWLRTLTPAQYPGIDPSVSNDPQYWLSRFRATNGQNPDYGFWIDNFFGIGGDHGSGSGSGGGNRTGTSGTGDLTWQQALQLANQAAGHTLSSAEIDAILQQFNGNTNRPSTVTRAGLDPVLAFLRSGASGGPTNGGVQPGDQTPGPNGTINVREPGGGLHVGGTSGGGTGGGGTGGGGGPFPPISLPGNTGQDPLSGDTSSALDFLLQGGTLGSNIRDQLTQILEGGGQLPGTQQRLNAARDAEAIAERAMLSDARAQLADRGLASQPGVPQGAEGIAIRRINESLAPTFAGAVSDIETHALDTANSNVMSALSLATGLTQDDAKNLLSAIGLSTNRQQVLSDIALRSLDQNIQWQEFLANFGLQRDQITQMIQNGNISGLQQLLQLFLQTVNVSTGGFI